MYTAQLYEIHDFPVNTYHDSAFFAIGNNT